MSGLAKGNLGMVGYKAGATQGPSQGDWHGVLRGFTLPDRRQEPLNDFTQERAAVFVLIRLFS